MLEIFHTSPICLNSVRVLNSWNMQRIFFLSKSCFLLSERCFNSVDITVRLLSEEVMVNTEKDCIYLKSVILQFVFTASACLCAKCIVNKSRSMYIAYVQYIEWKFRETTEENRIFTIPWLQEVLRFIFKITLGWLWNKIKCETMLFLQKILKKRQISTPVYNYILMLSKQNYKSNILNLIKCWNWLLK